MSKLIKMTKEKELKQRNKKSRIVWVYAIVVGLMLISFFGIYTLSNKYKTEVKVVSFKADAGNRTLITEDVIDPLSIVEKSYTDDMILWDEREKILFKKNKPKFTSNFVRHETPLYKDMISDEPLVRNDYLYELGSDEEALTLPYMYEEAGGKITIPGDKLRIRGSYPVLDAQGEKTNQMHSAVLFDLVTVKDLLNADGDSVYEIMKDAMRLPAEERETVLASDDFKAKLTPESIIMVVNTSSMDNYVSFKANNETVYTITLLSRDENLKENEFMLNNTLLNILESNAEGSGGVKANDSGTGNEASSGTKES